jgi:hypothetical protein
MKKYETESGFFFSTWQELEEILEKKGHHFDSQEQKEHVCKSIMTWMRTTKFKGRIKLNDVLDEIIVSFARLSKVYEKKINKKQA